MRIFGLVSLWAAAAAIAAYVLQLSPYTGIFLMLMGGPFLPGLLIHVCLIALFVEAWVRRVPRFLILVPLLAYGGYYALYFQESLALHARNEELRASNPGKVMIFDPSRFSLVDEYATRLVQSYAIPSAYSPSSSYPEGYFVHFMAPRSQCDISRDSQARVRMGYDGRRDWRAPWTRCDISFPQQPSLTKIEVVRSPVNRHSFNGEDVRQVAELRVDGVSKARFTTIYTSKMSLLPMLLAGCALSDSPSAWFCVHQFWKTSVALNGQAIASAYLDEEAPERIMLGLKRYNDDDLAQFKGYPGNEPLLVQAGGEAARVRENVFTTFQVALDDEDTPLPFGATYSIALQPERLSPLANRIAGQFARLIHDDGTTVTQCATEVRPDISADELTNREGWKHAIENTSGGRLFWDCWKSKPRHPQRDELLRVLAAALTALPDHDFLPLAPELFEALHQPAVNGEYLPDRHPLLYIRSGVAASPEALKKDYAANRFLPYLRLVPVLAMCRGGRADAETIALLKSDFATVNYDRFRQAVALTLLKMGERDWVKNNAGALSYRARSWLEALMNGKGWNKIGPNNCMVEDNLGSMDYLPDTMKPLLERTHANGDWVTRQ